MGRDIRWWIVAILGFIVGTCVSFAAMALILYLIGEMFNVRLMPRGIGWIIIPIAAGVATGRLVASIRLSDLKRISLQRPIIRIGSAAIVSWFLIVATFVYLAQPFGHYMYAANWRAFWAWMFIPPIIAGIIAAMFMWAVKSNNR